MLRNGNDCLLIFLKDFKKYFLRSDAIIDIFKEVLENFSLINHYLPDSEYCLLTDPKEA